MKKNIIKLKFSKILAFLCILCMTAALAGCSSSSAGGTSAGSKTLRVGVRSNIYGFGYLNEDTGKYYGLEIDIADELVSRLGYSGVEFVTVTPDTRKDMLLNDEIDCIIACYSIAGSREANFDFSPAYYQDASVVMVENSSLFTDIEDLKGYTFGTVAGANAAPQLVEKLAEIGFSDGVVLSSNDDNTDIWFDNFHILELDSYRELSDALETGYIDALCADGCIARTYLEDDRTILDFEISTQDYGVATQKDSELSPLVSDAIQNMLDDGTIAALIEKWD